MIIRNKLKIISIVSYLLLISIALYFKYFPTIINSQVSNIFISSSVFIFISLLVYGSFILEKPKDVYFLIPQSLMFTFLARAVPNLRFSYPPLHDPYYHFVCTSNIIEYGTLKPVLDWWYSGVDTQLHWPDMHLITTALVKITNFDVMNLFRFQEPAMGILFFLAVFLLTKTVTNNNGLALLAGLFVSTNDILIFFQSQYHPQGFSIIYFVLLFYTFLISRQVIDVRYRYISLIFGTVFVLSHYFTPLFLALIFSLYIAVTFMTIIFSHLNVIRDKYGNMFDNIKSDYVYFIILIIFSLSYHLFVYFEPFKEFLRLVVVESPLHTQLISFGQTNVPLLTSILSSCKWGLFLLSFISVLFIFRTKNTNEFRLGVILVCIISAGVIGNYVIMSPLDRLIGYYVPFAAIFASLTLHRFNREWFGGINQNRKLIVSVIIASMIMTGGFFNSQTPAYFFKDSKMDTYYWYSNKLPLMDEYKVAAEWVDRHTLLDSIFYTEFDTKIIVFYFGNRADKNVRYINPKNWITNANVVTNPNIIPNIPSIYNRESYLKIHNLIYSNGEIQIHN